MSVFDFYTDTRFSRRRFRRRVALVSFLCGVPIPTILLVVGMSSNDAAQRVSTMTTLVIALLTQAVPICMWYMKLGSDETKVTLKNEDQGS